MKKVDFNLTGNLGADPAKTGETHFGSKVVKFQIAKNDYKYDQESKKYVVSRTSWIPITVFGALAENVKRNIKKGERIQVQGRIWTSTYESKTGTNIKKFEFVADQISLPLKIENQKKEEVLTK